MPVGDPQWPSADGHDRINSRYECLFHMGVGVVRSYEKMDVSTFGHARQVEPIPKQTRPWQCRKDDETCTRKEPCASCRGARNRRSGLVKQRQGRKAIEAVTGKPSGKYASQTGQEENWRQAILCEAKSGAQVGPIATRFLAAEGQAHAAKAVGDVRPFAMLAMPKGWGSDGLFVCRLSELGRVAEALIS